MWPFTPSQFNETGNVDARATHPPLPTMLLLFHDAPPPPRGAVPSLVPPSCPRPVMPAPAP